MDVPHQFTMWVLWVKQNDAVFNSVHWREEQLFQKL
uniref:Uncharacterized protein n=1 Tax=Physcomitrium patens TaxID=3218 RepID=A0A2K1ITI1_PHYPA|nr:hypothetical protein PHYPA_024524 [Physcomitrium patens]